MDDLGIRPGDRLCVHSRLLSFGRVEGGPETLLSALQETVSDSGTLCFPTFTMNLDANTAYSVTESEPYLMGALSQLVYKRDGAVRSACPMHSYAAIGRDAGMMRKAAADRSVGLGSIFEVLQESGFKLLLLGCNFHEGATHVHHTEAVTGVPYREWLDLPRKVLTDGGAVKDISVRYYARRGDIEVKTDLFPFENAVRAEHPAAFHPVPGGSRNSFIMPLSEFDEITRKALTRDPYILIERTHVDEDTGDE
ncbi:AAC(3) family N-acetyltransferase [Hwanghaeella sp.]|uniref:AAC(3) family N-acetyltransferase n=1 Tax=Hwanghaeella sp. TaxID=2605943 RepID=UPI003CCBE0A6